MENTSPAAAPVTSVGPSPAQPQSLFSNLNERERGLVLFAGLTTMFVAVVFCLIGFVVGRVGAGTSGKPERIIRVITVDHDGKQRTYSLGELKEGATANK